jgi:UDP-2,3-diacylglucosamine pyrophosphatase LpxH
MAVLTRKDGSVYVYDIAHADKAHRMLLMSDVHFDSTHCDRDLLTKHLDEALATDAGVFIFGDWFDLMQGMYDPRRSYSGLRPEYKSITYLDDVIEDAADYLDKYRSIIKFIGRGNHETNIEKRLSTSPIDRLCDRIGAMPGPYAGWIVMRYSRQKAIASKLMHFHHGYGGAAPRSKGVLNADIDQKEWPDADIIVSGHTHQKWHLPVTVERINQGYNTYEETVHHVKLGSYKKLNRLAGWEVEKGFHQPRLGGWWLDVKHRRHPIERVYLEVTEAH